MSDFSELREDDERWAQLHGHLRTLARRSTRLDERFETPSHTIVFAARLAEAEAPGGLHRARPRLTPETPETREAQAYDALRLAKLSMGPVEPDGQGRSDRGELEVWITAGKVDQVAAEAFAVHDLGIELVAATIDGAVRRTWWRWVHHPDKAERWESPSTQMDMLIDLSGSLRGGLGVTSASKAATTAARKAYSEGLLSIRVARSPVREMARVAERTREALFDAARELLTLHCRRAKVDESSVIANVTGKWKVTQGEPVKFEHLTYHQVASLAVTLSAWVGQTGSFDPGETPAGMDAGDELPEMSR